MFDTKHHTTLGAKNRSVRFGFYTYISLPLFLLVMLPFRFTFMKHSDRTLNSFTVKFLFGSLRPWCFLRWIMLDHFVWVRRPPSFQELPSHLTSPGAHPRQEFHYVPLEMQVAFKDCSWQEKDLRKWPLHSTFWWNKGTGSIWLVLGFDHWFLIGQSGHFFCQS